jgi:hypothetical protein
MNDEMLKTIDDDTLADVAGGGKGAEIAAGLVEAGFEFWKTVTVGNIKTVGDAADTYRETVRGLFGL